MTDQLKELNENIASENYQAALNVMTSILRERNRANAKSPPAASVTPVLSVLPTLAEKAPWIAYEAIRKILDFDYILNSQEAMGLVTDAVLPIVHCLENGDHEDRERKTTDILCRLLIENGKSPENLSKIYSAAPSIIVTVRSAWEIASVISVVTEDNPPQPQLEAITEASLSVLPKVINANTEAGLSIIQSLCKANHKSRAALQQIRDAALSFLPLIAETDGEAAYTTISTVMPQIHLTDSNILCKHFARSSEPNGHNFMWIIPSATPQKLLVLDSPRHANGTKPTPPFQTRDIDYYQKITATGQSLRQMFFGKATPQQTAEKIEMETGIEYRVLAL